MQVLPRRVVGLLFDLRPRARAARNPPHSRPFRRRHHLGLPPPELQDSHKEGIAVRNASLEGLTLRKIRKTLPGDYCRATSTPLRRKVADQRGQRGVESSLHIHSYLLLGNTLREPS